MPEIGDFGAIILAISAGVMLAVLAAYGHGRAPLSFARNRKNKRCEQATTRRQISLVWPKPTGEDSEVGGNTGRLRAC